MYTYIHILSSLNPYPKPTHTTTIPQALTPKKLTNYSLVILCVLRVLVHNLNRSRDQYLLSNCAAILLNLASQVSQWLGWALALLLFLGF